MKQLDCMYKLKLDNRKYKPRNDHVQTCISFYLYMYEI